MEKILSYKNVSFRRDGREILKNINWEIKKDENWALLGLNGSGKSTLLSMIPAYTFATSGEVSVFEKKFGTCVWAEVKEKVGFVSSSLNTFSDSLNNQTLNNIVLSGKYNSIGIYREIFLKTLEESKSDIPFIYVTHQIEEIIPSITHVAILDNGEIVSQGNKFEVLTEENLSKLYGIDLKIEWSNDRPWLIVK